ncbi:hypothetical protein GGR57DRAFT_508644 [Xylariaceae sp. FL1272]|nr:hypothetical protein GGR57DRAFT_508644 [Xylariaceae sp. FL1272]
MDPQWHRKRADEDSIHSLCQSLRPDNAEKAIEDIQRAVSSPEAIRVAIAPAGEEAARSLEPRGDHESPAGLQIAAGRQPYLHLLLFTKLLTTARVETVKTDPHAAVRAVWISSTATEAIYAPEGGLDVDKLESLALTKLAIESLVVEGTEG